MKKLFFRGKKSKLIFCVNNFGHKGGGISKPVLPFRAQSCRDFEFPLIPLHLYRPAAGGNFWGNGHCIHRNALFSECFDNSLW